MREVETRLKLDGDTLFVQRTQDVEDILEHAKELAKQPNPKGDKFWHKWQLPNVEIEKLYLAYCKDAANPPPMNNDFWAYVDKIVMSDPDYLHFRTVNKSNPFFMGYNGN